MVITYNLNKHKYKILSTTLREYIKYKGLRYEDFVYRLITNGLRTGLVFENGKPLRTLEIMKDDSLSLKSDYYSFLSNSELTNLEVFCHHEGHKLSKMIQLLEYYVLLIINDMFDFLKEDTDVVLRTTFLHKNTIVLEI